MATISQTVDHPGAKARIISRTIIRPFPTTPAVAVALPKILPLSMTAERTRPAVSMRKMPVRLNPSTSMVCPAAASKDLCASVAALAYWPLRESIAKARLLAR